MSLREIARRIGVSPSLISQIERDKVNPSVSTLYALTQELGLNMGDLFTTEDDGPSSAAPADENAPVVTPEQRAVIKLASGVLWERLTPERDPTSSSSASSTASAASRARRTRSSRTAGGSTPS